MGPIFSPGFWNTKFSVSKMDLTGLSVSRLCTRRGWPDYFLRKSGSFVLQKDPGAIFLLSSVDRASMRLDSLDSKRYYIRYLMWRAFNKNLSNTSPTSHLISHSHTVQHFLIFPRCARTNKRNHCSYMPSDLSIGHLCSTRSSAFFFFSIIPQFIASPV